MPPPAQGYGEMWPMTRNRMIVILLIHQARVRACARGDGGGAPVPRAAPPLVSCCPAAVRQRRKTPDLPSNFCARRAAGDAGDDRPQDGRPAGAPRRARPPASPPRSGLPLFLALSSGTEGVRSSVRPSSARTQAAIIGAVLMPITYGYMQARLPRGHPPAPARPHVVCAASQRGEEEELSLWPSITDPPRRSNTRSNARTGVRPALQQRPRRHRPPGGLPREGPRARHCAPPCPTPLHADTLAPNPASNPPLAAQGGGGAQEGGDPALPAPGGPAGGGEGPPGPGARPPRTRGYPSLHPRT